jgi:anti-sigma regulatory factor (Ser/Thr protein kinase)
MLVVLNSELLIENHTDARAARARIVEYLRAQGAPESDFTAAELIVSELVGNALKHGTGWAAIRLEWNGERAVLHVRNAGDAFEVPTRLPKEPSSEGGRGLFLVASIAHGLRVEHRDAANHVQVVLPVCRTKPASSR